MRMFVKDESGQGMVEYGLIIALVALVAVAGLRVYGGGVKGLYDRSVGQMPFGGTGS